MTRNEIIDRLGWSRNLATDLNDFLDRIERIVRAAERVEREACAKVCNDHWRFNGSASECADAIRARK